MLDVLERCFADSANAWELDVEGRWTREVAPAAQRRSVQGELRERYAARAAEQLAAAGG
jgi:hypothetical protein